jgi:hypothetical protein
MYSSAFCSVEFVEGYPSTVELQVYNLKSRSLAGQSNVRSIKQKIELPGLCYSDALIGSNHHFHLLYFFFI